MVCEFLGIYCVSFLAFCYTGDISNGKVKSVDMITLQAVNIPPWLIMLRFFMKS